MSFLRRFIWRERGEKVDNKGVGVQGTITKLEKERKDMQKRINHLEEDLANCNRERNEDELIAVTKRLKYMERKERMRAIDNEEKGKQKEKMKMIKEEIRMKKLRRKAWRNNIMS